MKHAKRLGVGAFLITVGFELVYSAELLGIQRGCLFLCGLAIAYMAGFVVERIARQ